MWAGAGGYVGGCVEDGKWMVGWVAEYVESVGGYVSGWWVRGLVGGCVGGWVGECGDGWVGV